MMMRRMATVRRSRSGPLAQRYSTDVIVVVQPTASELSGGGLVKRDRFSFGIGAMHRTSLGIDLDNVEWEKKVMNAWPKKCTFVVREILQTERTYIASLEEIILGYMMPLHGYLLAMGEGPNFIHTVFGNINKLRQLHEELLAKLHAACGDPHEFADVFIEADFAHYREYCTHYEDANFFLQKSMNDNEKLKMFIIQCQNDLEHALPLHSHLIKPVQRILKYHLMLREMLKYTDSEDVIYTDVEEAHGKMKKVAEEINTSFKKERSEEVATPSTIARRRTKQIQSLQRRRSAHLKTTRPCLSISDKSSELQRSLEFEDSLDLLRGNMSSARPCYPAKSVSSRRIYPRPPLTQFIGMFESSKPATGGLCPPLPLVRPSPPPKPTALHSPPPNQSLAPAQRASPTPSSPSHINRPLSSSIESSSSSDSSSGRTSSGEGSSANPKLQWVRKTPLALRKSAPVVQRSKAQAHGKRGDWNSLCDSAHSSLVESQAVLGNCDKSGEIETTAKPTTPEPVVKRDVAKERPVPTLPQKPQPPPQVKSGPGNKAKKPQVPPKQVLLPDKPAVAARTTYKKPTPPHTTQLRKPVPPRVKLSSNKSLDDQEKFVIDVSSGQPVVSLPPVWQQQQYSPSPPPTTFFPSMLKPSKSSVGGGVGVRSSVLAQQEQMIEEMIISGAGSRQATTRMKQNPAPSPPRPTTGNSATEQSRKVPLLPPTTKSQAVVRPRSPTTQHKMNVALPTSA